jgi:hypothetical protein
MKPIRTRLLVVAAALSAIAVAAPVSTAGAATAPAAARPTDTIIGATYLTYAPSTFVNTNNQVSPGNNSSGNQDAA